MENTKALEVVRRITAGAFTGHSSWPEQKAWLETQITTAIDEVTASLRAQLNEAQRIPAERDAQLRGLRDVHAIQGNDGNWDADEYMRGMFNGLELALAIFEGREPAYKATRKPTQDKE